MDVRRQLQQRIDLLRAAGVDLIPKPVPDITASTEPVVVVASSDESSLIAEVKQLMNQSKRTSLELLAKEVADCKKCPELFSTRTQTVFGVGNISPDLCFVGEAPGADEDAKGEPFVGRAGQLLDKIIFACGFQRSEVYICNTLKCRPPNNATPTPVQCENCRPFFEHQIDLLKPKFLCCLGAVASKNVLATETGITKLRGKLHYYRGIPVVCTYHPAYLLRNPTAKADCWADMKFLLAKMGRNIPAKPA